MTTRVDIGVFAHNEADGIADVLAELAGQSLFSDPAFNVHLHVLANGCTDDTAARAREYSDARPGWHVQDLTEGGKSRTWNVFVHEISRPETAHLLFCDADITLPNPDTLRGLVGLLDETPDLAATVSRPVKDIAHDGTDLSGLDRLIAAAGGTLDDWSRAICGQLYAMRAEVARGFHLPIGLPVEDGFVRAMIVTDVLSGTERADRITGRAEFFHVYASERGLRALIRHQVRIVIGSAINSVLFGVLVREGDKTPAQRLKDAALDPDWLAKTLKNELPRARYGYVPTGFLTKRLKGFGARKGIKQKAVVLAGFGFDALVYVIAQWRMARGTGAGFW